MTKPSKKQTTYKTKQQTQGGQLAPRPQAEDEPTMSISTSIASASSRNVESVRGCRGRTPGLWDVASQSERRGFVSNSERFPQTAQRPGVAMPQQSKLLAPPSWGGETTYKTTHTNNEGVRGRTPSGTGAGTPSGTPSDTPLAINRQLPELGNCFLFGSSIARSREAAEVKLLPVLFLSVVCVLFATTFSMVPVHERLA